MSEKQTKHLEQTLATCVYSHCSICTILVYFCNINAKHLQHTTKTSKTIETYACNMRFRATSPWCLPHRGSATTRVALLRQVTMPLPSKIIHEQAGPPARATWKTSTWGRGGGVSRQLAHHDTITNRRAARLRTPVAKELIYYTPPTEGCAMGWHRKRLKR